MFNEGIKSFIAGTDLAQAVRVKINSDGIVTTAGADHPGHGVTMYSVKAGDPVAIRLINYPGTFEMTAAGGFDVGQAVYAAADGKVQALPATTGTYYRVGTAVENATADGDIVEILPDDHISTKTVA